ncbi:MAG TPA: ferric reductase [Candidatus Dormibacteraeota bacterium]
MSNSLLWYTTRGAGVVSLLLLTGVVVLGVLSVRRFEAAGWPRFLTVGLHRNVSLLALVFLGVHILTAVVDPFTSLGWVPVLIPFGSYYRTFWLGLGTVAFELLLAIVVTSLLRAFIGAWAWRLVHWLAYAAWPIAVLHGIGTGTDAGSFWLLAIQVLCAVAVLAAVALRLLTSSPDPLAADRARFRERVSREP